MVDRVSAELKQNRKIELGNASVRGLEPGGKDYFVWDTKVLGFGVKVTPAGNRIFVYQYRNRFNKTKRATLGRFGKITAFEARKMAEVFRAEVSQGKDPVEEKKSNRNAKTVGQVLNLYLESDKFSAKAEITQKYDRARVSRHLLPLLGNVIASELTKGVVETAFKEIKEGKTASDEKLGFRSRSIVKGGEGAARGAIRLLRSALSWAVGEGILTSNAAKGVDIGQDGERKLILPNVQQYEDLFRTLEKMESERRIRQPVADVIRLIALTGARKSEIAGLRWSYVDLKNGLLIIPASEHKTGKRTNRAKEIGLPVAAQAIISRQPEGEPQDLIFPSTTGGVVSLNKIWRKIRREACLPEGIGLHGLRHSYASQMAMQGAEAAQIMAALGHRQLSTTQRYINYAKDAKQELAEKHSAGIAGALNGNESATLISTNKNKR